MRQLFPPCSLMNAYSTGSQLICCYNTQATLQRGVCGKELTPANNVREPCQEWVFWCQSDLQMTAAPIDVLTCNLMKTQGKLLLDFCVTETVEIMHIYCCKSLDLGYFVTTAINQKVFFPPRFCSSKTDEHTHVKPFAKLLALQLVVLKSYLKEFAI